MNKIIIRHYVRVTPHSHNKVYENGEPKIAETVVDLPVRFGYDSYDEPRRVLNTDINADHVLEIKPFIE